MRLRSLVAGAVAALALVAVIIILNSADAPAAPASSSPTGSPQTTTGAAAAATSPPIGTAMPTPAPTLAAEDVSSYFQSLVPAGWRPWPVTILVASTGSETTTVTAVPVDTALGTPTEIVRLLRARDWSARADGTIVASVATSPGSARLAIWEPATASARWLTPDDATLPQSAAWSPDGRTIYYLVAPHTCTGACFSMYEIRADGSGVRRISEPSDRPGEPRFVTPDGKALVWRRSQAGGSTDVLDLTTGENRAFPEGGSTQREGWRAARPRALVLTGTCCVSPRGELHLWDDISGATSMIVGPRATDALGVSNAVWDPDGRRIAATSIDDRGVISAIALLDETGSQRTQVAGSADLFVRAWVSAGLIAVRTPAPGTTTMEIVLVSPDSGASSLLFTLRDAQLAQVLVTGR